MEIILTEEQYGRLIHEELYKWNPEEAKKIIEGYKSINDFRTDYPKIYDAIRSRKLIPELLGHLERGVSYKTGEPVKIGGNIKYTEDDLRKKAEKYNSIGDLKKYDNKTYESIRKYNRLLWDELQSTMDRKHNSKSPEELLSLANQYGDDFIKIEPKLYADAVRRRIIEPQRKRWTADEIQDIADGYVDLNKFIKEQNAAYQMALKMGIKDDVIEHMRVRSRNLSFEVLQKMAEPFKHKIEFLRSDPSAYNKAAKEGWLDKLKEWIPLGNKEMRMVYVYEFRNKKGEPLAVYVGLTANENRRDKQHKNILVAPDKKLSPVYKYIVANKIQPTKKILSDGYVPYRDAIDMECYYQNDYYKKDKYQDGSLVWKPLHSMKCGGLGGLTRWTEDKIRKEVAKYNTLRDFNKYSAGASFAAKRNGIYDEITKHLFKRGDDKTSDFNKFLNGTKTDLSQLDLLNLETFYKRITPENENKFLQRLKSVVLKNKISLSGRNNKNTLRTLNRRLYNGIVSHDKLTPNNKWVSYLFPNHVYGIGESKLSFENILKGILLENDKPTMHPKNKVLIQKAEFAYTKHKNGTYLFQDDVRQRTAVLWELPDEVEFGFVHDPENGNTPKITLNSDMKGTIVYTIYNDDRTIKKISETNLLKIPILGDATHFPYKYTCMHIKKLMGRLGRTHINFNGYNPG